MICPESLVIPLTNPSVRDDLLVSLTFDEYLCLHHLFSIRAALASSTEAAVYSSITKRMWRRYVS
jgi:hypothetical protein